MLEVPTGASSSEDYRSVIDDLTVQNKKLKRKLKKFEKLQDAHLQDDKLFEIRVHALPADKKRELEEMLRKFSMTLDGSDQPSRDDRGDKSTRTGTNKSSDRIPAALDAIRTSPSHTSTKFGDSAYASMSVSGQHSMAPSGQGLQRKQLKNAMYLLQDQNQNQNIHSYLKDIPAGLLPKHTVAMSEKAKRKTVVRRLEQIFAGKEPTISGHQQPMQQEEVAQSAARADRKAIEDSGRHAREEGAREARIMRKSKDPTTDHVTEPPMELQSAQYSKPTAEVHGPDSIRSDLEQRPTRPLDLDPYRAQVPAENIEYIRHLGFSPMDPDSVAPAPDGHGWIYLNLLINMAQLHTINVTADFVRRSIADFSNKLELSSDGRKVRWKGGTDVTRTSSDSSPEHENRAGSSLMKRPKSKSSSTHAMVSNDSSSENVSNSRKKTSSKSNSRDKLAYTPLFFHHKAESGDEDEFSEDIGTSWSSPPAGFIYAGNSPGFTSSGKRTNSSRKRKGDDGPIIFYNKATFCTDLSGDPRPRNVVFANTSVYDRLATDPIGMQEEEISAKEQLDLQGPLSRVPTPPDNDSMDMDTSSPGDEMDIDVNPMKGKFSEGSSSEESPNVMDFEASGIGGVLLEDNFAIRVKSRRTLIDYQEHSSIGPKDHRIKAMPPHLRSLLASRDLADPTAGSVSAKNSSVVEEEILSARRRALPPSELPPASFFPFSSLDGDDFDSDKYSESSDKESSDSTDENAGLAHDRPLPTSAPQQLTLAAYDSGSESSGEDNASASEHAATSGRSSSVDLLAHARRADPRGVRQRERDFDAERLPDEIPAGSSAANAGGGSGYSSPARGTADDWPLGGRPGRPLKRNRTSESVLEHRVAKSPRVEGE